MKVESDLTLSQVKVDSGTLTAKAIFNIPDYPRIPPPVTEPPVVVPPVIEFPPGVGIRSGFQDAINSATDKPVYIGIDDYKSMPNLILKPGVSLIGAGNPGSVTIRPAVKKGYESGKDNSDAWLRIVSPTRIDRKGQKIANIKILGEGAQGGIFTENIDNLAFSNIEIGLCSFMGFWARNSKGLRVDGLRLYDNSWCSNEWASGEFCYVELDDFLVNNVHVSSSSAARGYGFKALWGVDGPRFRSVYNGKFTNLRIDMHHQSNWSGGKSNNIGFEMQSVHLKGNISIEDSTVENQVSLHQADAGGSTGSFKYLRNKHNGENDRYCIEYIMNNVEVANNSIVNCSQFLFNGQPNIKVKNGNIHHNTFDQGTAPDVDWGATFLFGKDGAENINIKSNTIRRRAVTELLKFQGVQGGVNIDPDNVIKTY